jgi:arsenate reductase-like glutaredoxin family protein
MIDHLLDLYTAENNAVVYHFIDHLEQAAGTCLAVLRSLLRQLSDRLEPLPMAIMTLYDKLNTKDKEIRLEETKLAMQACINMFDRVFVVIDALDEATPQERSILLSSLKSLASRCKIIVTSRPHLDDVSRAFHDDPRIDVTARDGDLQLYLRARMYSTCHSFLGNEAFMDQIIRTIIYQAHGL